MNLITAKGYASSEPFVRVAFTQHEPYPRHLEKAAKLKGEVGMGYRNIMLNIQQERPVSISFYGDEFTDPYIQGQVEAIADLGVSRQVLASELNYACHRLMDAMAADAMETFMFMEEAV